MNKFLYLFITLFAIGFFSCSKDDVNSVTETNTPTTLKLTIANVGVSTKATGLTTTGGGVGTDEGTVNSMIVGVFKCTQSTPNDNDPLDKITEIPTGSLGSSISVKELTAGDRSVIVVTNYDDAAKTALLAAKTRGAFLATTINLSVTTGSTTTTAGSTQVATYLPMSGEANDGTDNVIKLSAAATATASVTLSRLVAKISINTINTSFITPYANATFDLDKIFIYGALESSTVAVGTNTTVPSAVTLINGGTVSGSWAIEKPYLLDAGALCSFSPVTPVTTYSTPHSFYVFANGNGTYPLKLVLGGEFDMDGTGTVATPSTTYYPIIINQTTLTSSTGVIARNTIYNVTATIKGIGVTNPSENILPANLTLSVTPAEWTTSNQTVEFN